MRSALDDLLRARLIAVGLHPSSFGDPGEAWRTLQERFGRRVTLVDRYALEAETLGVAADDLPLELRDALGREVLAVQFPGFAFVGDSSRAVRDPIGVIPYDPDWPLAFAHWRTQLRVALAPNPVRIEHVGSTAVTGLAAKPVIDVQVSVTDLEDEPAYVPAIERIGIALRSREPVRRYFRPSGDLPRVVQVHVCATGSEWEREHLLFRDYLRTHPEARDDYAALKTRLAERYWDDRLGYTEAKTGFILDVLERAERWASEQGWAC